MKRLILLISLIATNVCAKQLPEDARLFLSNLPQKAVSLPVVLERSFKFADEVERLKAVENAKYENLGPLQGALSPKLNATYGISDDSTLGLTVTTPSDTKVSLASVGVEKAFSTGTTIEAKLNHSKNTIAFSLPTFADIDAHEYSGTIKLSQNLWRDSFGASFRSALKGVKKQVEAKELEFLDGSEDFAMQMIELYYNAWLTQVKVEAARESSKRYQKLKRVMAVKRRRGTATESAYTQILGAIQTVEVSQIQAQQALDDIWRALAIALKFPEHWLSIDPVLIPMVLDDDLSQALGYCEDSNYDSDQSISYRRWRTNYESSSFNVKSKKWAKKPLLAASIGLTYNGVDSESSEALESFQEYKNRALEVGVSLQWPLSNIEKETAYKVAVAQNKQAQAILSQVKSSLKVNRINYCSQLKRGVRIIDRRLKTLALMKKRLRLDNDNFRNGRITVNELISAEDDLTSAKVNLGDAKSTALLVAWEIKRIHGALEKQITTYLMEK